MNIPPQSLDMAKKAIQAHWSDIATIFRADEKSNVANDFKEVYIDIPCHLSATSNNALQQSNTAAMAASLFTLFVDTDITIFTGDKLQIKHKGQVFDGIAGIPINGSFSNSVKLEAVKIA